MLNELLFLFRVGYRIHQVQRHVSGHADSDSVCHSQITSSKPVLFPLGKKKTFLFSSSQSQSVIRVCLYSTHGCQMRLI